MSLDPHWFSTDLRRAVHGRPGALGAGASASWCVALPRRRAAARAASLRPEHVHDLGKLLLAFVMLWAYVTFSQFLIIWSGNLPEEIPWYLAAPAAAAGSTWRWLLVLFHFALPFLLLLSRDLKRNARTLARVAAAGAGRCASSTSSGWSRPTWRATTAHGGGLHPHWLDLAALLAIGGVWLHAVRARAARAGRCCRWASPSSRSCWRRTRRDRPRRPERSQYEKTDADARARSRRSASGIAGARDRGRRLALVADLRRAWSAAPSARTTRAARRALGFEPGPRSRRSRGCRASRSTTGRRCSAPRRRLLDSYGWVDEQRRRRAHPDRRARWSSLLRARPARRARRHA